MAVKESREGEFECDDFRAQWNGGSLTISSRDEYINVDGPTARRFARWLTAMTDAVES